MNFDLREDKFHVRAYFASCACYCRFCCLGTYPKNRMISFDEYEQVMRKFAHIDKDYGMRLRSFIYNCPEHNYIKRQIQLYDSLPMEPTEYTQLDLNGTKIKPTDQIDEWINEMIDSGVKKVAFSWFGINKTHNDFVRKEGYFEYLKECAQIAKKKGVPVISKIFLHRGILSELDQVIETVSAFSDVVICAFMEYSGNAKTMQSEFLTQSDFKKLSPKALSCMSEAYIAKFKTEKQWIELAQKNMFPQFNIVDYILYVTKDNLNWVLETSTDKIIEYFRNKNEEFQKSFGTIAELAAEYGDRECDCLYECRDILRKWLDLYYNANNLNKLNLFSFTNDSVEWKVYERL